MKKFKEAGIRLKLIAVIVPIMLCMVVAFFYLARKELLNESRALMYSDSAKYAEDINGWAGDVLSDMRVYKAAAEDGGFASDEDMIRFMEISVDRNPNYPVGIYIGDDKGHYLDASGWVPDDDWVLVERDWYKEGITHDELAFGEPYVDAQAGEVCVSVTSKMKYPEDPTATRVISVDVYLDYISELMKGVQIGEGESLLVTNSDLNIIGHRDAAMLDRQLDASDMGSIYNQMGGLVKAGQTGIYDIKGPGGKYFVCINKIENVDWTFVTFENTKSVLRDLHRLENIMIAIAVIASVVIILFCVRIMDKVVKPVSHVTDVLSGIAEGDFTQEVEIMGSGEIAEMSGNMALFMDKMREVISDLKDTADWLSSQSQENGRVSENLMVSSKDQEDEMRDLSAAVEELSGAAENLQGQMSSLLELINSANEKGAQVNVLMDEAVTASHTGREAMENIKKDMHEIETAISSLSSEMKDCEAATEQIRKMVAIITDIADETNLLSLNASIEAARAGEAGRGFAVVAEQIGKLAQNSSSAAKDISSSTEDIVRTVSAAAEQTGNSVEIVKSSAELVNEASDTFRVVFEKVETSGEIVGNMVELVGKVSGVADQMDDTVGIQVRSTSEINNATDKMELSAKSFSESSESVAQSAQDLEKESTNLMDAMKLFKI